MEACTIEPVAHIENDFTEKFGIPRQAGLAEGMESLLVFEPAYRNPDCLREIEGFSHLWLIWQFSKSVGHEWSPTVRPPRLGGNRRVGVFATRSPFRPNNLGLSCVRLLGMEKTADRGTVLRVAGADLMNGTPVFDIKPYIPYADCKPDAAAGFAPDPGKMLKVAYAPGTAEKLPAEKQPGLTAVLARDPRPQYQNDPERVYAMSFGEKQVRFRVEGDTLTVVEIV